MDAKPATLAQATLRGVLWNWITFGGSKLMIAVSTVILARWLSQDDFGVVAFAVTAINFLDVFSDFGIGAALIYHAPAPALRNTAFWLAFAFAVALYGFTWLAAPALGWYFQDDRAVLATRILGLTFLFGALGDTHDMLLRKDLAFKRKSIADLAQSLGKGGLSIGLAIAGFGPWSLILGQVGGTLIGSVARWCVYPWLPTLEFSKQVARSLLSYGTRSTGLALVWTFLLNVDYLFVGRFLGAIQLGIYTLAFRIPDLLIMQFCNIIARVVFPIYTRVRDDFSALQTGFLTTTRYVALITVPVGLGLALVAEPFVVTVFTDKWLAAVPILQLLCVYAVLFSLGYNSSDVYKALGRLDILNKVMLVRAALLTVAIWIAVQFVGTIVAVGWAQVIATALGTLINLTVTARVLKLQPQAIVRSLFPALLSAGCMCLAVSALITLMSAAPATLLLTSAGLFGLLTYGIALWWFQREVIFKATHLLQSTFQKRQPLQ